jgi:hypothetical protein
MNIEDELVTYYNPNEELVNDYKEENRKEDLLFAREMREFRKSLDEGGSNKEKVFRGFSVERDFKEKV